MPHEPGKHIYTRCKREFKPAVFFPRVMVGLLIGVIILYVAVLAVSETAGFRSLVRARIKSAVGLDMRIDKAFLDLRWDLHLEGCSVHGHDDGEGTKPMFKATGLSLRRDWNRIAEIEIEEPRFVMDSPDSLTLQRHELSGILTRLAPWLGDWAMDKQVKLHGLSANKIVINLATKTNSYSLADADMFTMSDAQLEWMCADKVVAHAQGVDFCVSNMEAPTRGMKYWVIGIRYLQSPEITLRDFYMEFITIADSIIVVTMDSDHSNLGASLVEGLAPGNEE